MDYFTVADVRILAFFIGLLSIIVFVSIYFYYFEKPKFEERKKKMEEILNSDEFKGSLERIREIEAFFKNNWRTRFVHFDLCGKPYEYITSDDYDLFKYAHAVYIHVNMDLSYDRKDTIEKLHRYSETMVGSQERDVLEPYVLSFFCVSDISQMPEHYSADSIIRQFKDEYITDNGETIDFFLPFLCPCNLHGEDRNIFLNKIKE